MLILDILSTKEIVGGLSNLLLCEYPEFKNNNSKGETNVCNGFLKGSEDFKAYKCNLWE